jgi:hypothetical protein
MGSGIKACLVGQPETPTVFIFFVDRQTYQ